MKVKLNGEEITLRLERTQPNAAALNLQQLLRQLGYLNDRAANFVVAHNQALVPQQSYAKVQVNEQDSIDILSVITGG